MCTQLTREAALHAAKKALREELKLKLKNIPCLIRKRQSDMIFKKLLENEAYLSSQRISVYLSRAIEVDTESILMHLFNSNKQCFIPKYAKSSTHMDMVRLSSMEEYRKLPQTSWKIKQPECSDDSRENALTTGGLDLIIVPGIGFTKDGDRIGNGKGYYDIYMKKYTEQFGKLPHTIALALQEQIVPSIPTGENDIKIDEVIFTDEDLAF